MKKAICQMVVVLISMSHHTQAQLHRWAISPIQVEMITNPFVTDILEYPNQVNASAPKVTIVGNSMHDSNNDLLFYVSNNKVYDKYSSQIGSSLEVSNAEISIVPFGDNGPCQKKFSIFTMAFDNEGVSIIRYELDMLTYTLSDKTIIDKVMIKNAYGGIAVSATINLNGERNIYTVCGTGAIGKEKETGGEVRKIIIDKRGNKISAEVLFIPPHNSGVHCKTAEVDLSPDGNYLLWASYSYLPDASNTERYHLLNMKTFEYKPFNISNLSGNSISGFRGVEFVQYGKITKIFLAAGDDGVYVTDPTLEYFNLLPGSSIDYGFSQIEFSHDGLLYIANCKIKGLVNSFNPIMLLCSEMGSFHTMILAKDNIRFDCPKIISADGEDYMYTLPDQIDGEDYSLNLSAPNPQTASTDVYIHNLGTTTWKYGLSVNDNPWKVTNGAIQVISELRIKDNSHLTIDNMKFQFSPNAKVIIEQGSTLTLDNGAIFTSDIFSAAGCDRYYEWQGIEVWGTSTLSQIAPNAQGKLEVKNNSIIEYATLGVYDYVPEPNNIAKGKRN